MIQWDNESQTVVAAIWCRSLNYVIGFDNKIPWNIPSDSARFRRITTAFPDISCEKLTHCIVTRPTYESFPGKIWPGRKMYVLTHNENYKTKYPSRQIVINSLYDPKLDINLMRDFAPVLFIVGGSNLYMQVFKDDFYTPDILIEGIYQKEVFKPENAEKVYMAPKVTPIAKEYKIITEDDIKTKIICMESENIIKIANKMYDIAQIKNTR